LLHTRSFRSTREQSDGYFEKDQRERKDSEKRRKLEIETIIYKRYILKNCPKRDSKS
jgi:hypothetical protein